MAGKTLSASQMEVLRIVAAGECTHAGYGNSNCDLRSFHALRRKGLIEYKNEKAWATDAGRALLTSTGD